MSELTQLPDPYAAVGPRTEEENAAEARDKDRYRQDFSYQFFERMIRSENPWSVRVGMRELALHDVIDIWNDEGAASPNMWKLARLTDTVEERTGALRLGALGKEFLGRAGFDKGEVEATEPQLIPEEREKLIEALNRSEEELKELNRFHRLVAQMLAVTGDKDTEIGMFGHYREVKTSAKMLEVIGNMEALVPGERHFGDKVTIAMRAIDDLARGRVPWVPRPFSHEPNLGIRRTALGYALQAVAGPERTEALWKDSPLEQLRNPYKYAIQEALVQSFEDQASGMIQRDFIPEERQKLFEKILEGGEDFDPPKKEVLQRAVDKRGQGLTEGEEEALTEAMQSGKLDGVPDIYNFRAKIESDPGLMDSFRACVVGWYLYRWLRKDVDHSVQPSAQVVTEDSLYHTFVGVPTKDEEGKPVPIWHCENGDQAGDLVVAMQWITRSLEEGLRRKRGLRARWAGPDSLLGIWPNWTRPVDNFVFFRREVKDGDETRIESVSLEELLFGDEIKIKEGDEERRPFLRDCPLGQIYIEEDQLWKRITDVTAEDESLEHKPMVSHREDFTLLCYLSRSYMSRLYKLFINPDPEKGGYLGSLSSLGNVEQQKKLAKPTELGVILLCVANGLEEDREHEAMMDYLFVNGCGSLIHECFPPQGLGLKGADRYKEETGIRKGKGKKIGDRGGAAGEQQIDKVIREVFDALVDARVFPSSDTPEGRERLKILAKAMTFVAKTGQGLLPGDFLGTGFWGDTIEEEKETIERIRESHLFEPYRVVRKERVAKQFIDYDYKKNVPDRVRGNIGD